MTGVVEQINIVAHDLKAFRADDLRKSTVINVMTANNMGMSFGTLVIFAIISGFFIIGLTMYSATYDRIKDYGTLKAIGATSSYITRLVIAQAFLYSVVGFIVSLILLFGTKVWYGKGGLNNQAYTNVSAVPLYGNPDNSSREFVFFNS